MGPDRFFFERLKNHLLLKVFLKGLITLPPRHKNSAGRHKGKISFGPVRFGVKR